MLLGGDLRFWFSVVAVVLGWLVGRWKWRRAAARREEIRRLMAFASAEAARAELEAAASYRIYASSVAPEPAAAVSATVSGISSEVGHRQFQHQCEVCFSPTTTRCKQCKAVHYCSRKCQILHWRQGHKDECNLFTANQNSDVGIRSRGKEYEQDGSSCNTIGIEEMHSIKPVESSSEKCMSSNPSFHEIGENVDFETEARDNRKRTDPNMEGSVHSPPDECSSPAISIETSVASDSNLKDYNIYNGESTSTDAKSTMPHLSQPNLTNRESAAASSVSNQLRFDRIDTDEISESSPLSGSSAACSEENSPSGSSTPSSDFWAGTVEHMRSKTKPLDECGYVEMSNSHSSSPPSSSRVNNDVEMVGPDMNTVTADVPCPARSMPPKLVASPEMSEDGLDSREPPSLSSKPSVHHGDGNTSTKCSSTEEAKLSLFDARRRGKSEGTPVVDDSNLQSLAPKKLGDKINGRNGILDTLKCQQNDSSRLSSIESHMSASACTRKPSIQVLQSVQNEHTHDNASCSLDSRSSVQNAKSGTNLSMRRIVDQLRVSNFIRNGSLGAGSGIIGRYEGSFPYELFVKLYNWTKVELSPSGLINCGNSCYANVVLQCLAFTPPLAAYCLEGYHAKICKNGEWCFTCEFEELVKKAKESNNPLSPARIMSHMQRIGSHLGNGREEDAHEFLRYAIDAMQSACLKEAEFNVRSPLVEESTLLGLTFGGYIQSKIECMRCGFKSKQHERIMDLTVEIEGDIGSLEDALHRFTRSEILDGENKYHCVRCKSYEKAKKKLRVSEAPNVLVIALKRFQTGKYGKLNKAVKFPEILNLAPYMIGTSDKSPIYRLYGVVVHLDVMNSVFSGHYVCYIKNNRGRWFKADDSVVQGVELEKVLSNDGYILFYARCSPRAPKAIRSLMIPRDHRKQKNKIKPHSLEPWDYRSYPSRRSNSEVESCLSEYSSSYFSEAGSHSTESSNRESVSTTDENFDLIFGDSWNRTRHSSAADVDRWSSDMESSSSCSVNASPKIEEGDGFRGGQNGKDEVPGSKGRGNFLCSSSSKECSRSNRENDFSRLGSNKSSDNVKGVYLRSMS